jgi:hypothetical protein
MKVFLSVARLTYLFSDPRSYQDPFDISKGKPSLGLAETTPITAR